MDTPNRVYSIGHSNLSSDAFLDLLQLFSIDALVDVRSSPYSQYLPHFNRPELQHFLNANSIEYLFAGEFLGGRPQDPQLYKAREIPEGKADYLNLVDYPAVARTAHFRRGLQRLMDVAKQRTVAIMCSEEDPLQCHRHHLIANELDLRNIAVVHIRKSGILEPFQPKTVISTVLATTPQQKALF
jgi:uncharacterized protein (DUF488 family)